MRNGVLELDHVMVSVASSAAAGAAFERLGFTATPRSAMMGLSNRLVCFPSADPQACNFVELLGIDEPDVAPDFMKVMLAETGAPVSLVMATADARAAEAELRAAGFDPAPTLDIERKWALPGETLNVAFSVVLPKRGVSPLYWNLCQYRTRQHYVRPDFTTHANGAQGLVAALAVTDDADAVAEHFAEAWGAPLARRADGARAVKPGKVELRVFSPREFARTYPAVSLPRGPAGLAGVVLRADLGRPHLVLDEVPRCLIAFEA